MSGRRSFIRRVLSIFGIAGVSAVLGAQAQRVYGTPSGNPREVGEDYISFVNAQIIDDSGKLKLADLAGTTIVQAELCIENRTDDPGSPEVGRIWLRTDL